MPDINRADMNRAISELIEPYESLPYGDHLDAEYRQCDTSPKEGWILTMVLSPATGFHVLDWQPRAWDTDETANAMILEMLPMPLIRKERDGRWWITADSQWPEHWSADEQRKTAVRNCCYEWLTQRQGVK